MMGTSSVIGTVPEKLSVMQMFMGADWVVKAVMLSLLASSVISWTIFVVKKIQLNAGLKRSGLLQKYLLNQVQTAGLFSSLQLPEEVDMLPESSLLSMVRHECEAAKIYVSNSQGIKERVAQGLTTLEKNMAKQMFQRIGILASVSSVAPFVGLFGTVWGIMNSFIGIAASNTTNLAVVAPGIAEALLATGAGLLAAIPAALFYNYFTRLNAEYRQSLNEISSATIILLSRQLDDQQGSKNIFPQSKEVG